ncbi:membrane protein [Kurthia zopfii]|nr:membrane protein [Kurthia zopfii]
MGYDKRKAIKREWRVPEKSLWLLALIGGAPGAFLGMIVFRHKIKKMKFVVGFTLLMLIDFVIYGSFYFDLI